MQKKIALTKSTAALAASLRSNVTPSTAAATVLTLARAAAPAPLPVTARYSVIAQVL